MDGCVAPFAMQQPVLHNNIAFWVCQKKLCRLSFLLENMKWNMHMNKILNVLFPSVFGRLYKQKHLAVNRVLRLPLKANKWTNATGCERRHQPERPALKGWPTYQVGDNPPHNGCKDRSYTTIHVWNKALICCEKNKHEPPSISSV